MADEDDRMGLRIDPDLKVWFKGYANRIGTPMSVILVDHIKDLRKKDDAWFDAFREDGDGDG